MRGYYYIFGIQCTVHGLGLHGRVKHFIGPILIVESTTKLQRYFSFVYAMTASAQERESIY